MTLRDTLMPEGVEFVDPFESYGKIPKLGCFEHEQTVAADFSDRTMTMPAVRPYLAQHMNHDSSWEVDMVRDARTGRCVGELCLPTRACVHEIVNVPAPPSLPPIGPVPKFGFGRDSISVFCTPNSDVLRIYLPTAEEIIHEILLESGVIPLPDEKRDAYMPALDLLGGLSKAAHSFKRRLRQVLRVLRDASPPILPPYCARRSSVTASYQMNWGGPDTYIKC